MKKGELQLSLEVIIQFMLFALVAFAFIMFYRDVEKNDLFEKSYAARDIALLLETAQAVPGDVEVYYTQPYFDVSTYNYKFTDHLVQILDSENAAYRMYYPFFLDDAVYQTFDTYTFEQPAAFVISKVHGQLTVKEETGIALQQPQELSCSTAPSTKTEKMSLVVVTADSSFAAVQRYFTDPQNLKVDFYNKDTAKDSITAETSLVLAFASDSGKTLTIDIPKDQQSEKLGCLIAQEILAAFPYTDMIDIQTSTDAIITTNTDGLAVRLIIGEDIPRDDHLTTAIYKGIEGYYE